MSFYVTGGTLQSDAPSYVEREADRRLFEGLRGGEFCYVLTARQMGKSSLMVRTANRLQAAGVHVVVLDLTALGGQNITAEQWYFGLLDTLGGALDLTTELEAFWDHSRELGPLHRFMKAVRQVVLPRLRPDDAEPARGEEGNLSRGKVRLVIFVDEIDFVRSLPFSTDEFFAAIRECYNHRTMDPVQELLTFCLLGVASPSDLIRDTRTTPFNIGRRVELNDFTLAEAAPLAQGLEELKIDPQDARLLLARILYWTEGHPYLTQRLCRATAESVRTGTGQADYRSGSHATLVDRLCTDLFFCTRARERDDNLIFVRDRLLRSDADLSSLLELYSKVWQGKRVMDDEFDPLISLLNLSGVVRVAGGRLRERNRIYGRVFDGEWVRSNLPKAELRRQREAYRRGVIWAATVSSVIVVLMAFLVMVALRQAGRQRVALARAHFSQARTERLSGRPGQRLASLSALQKAAATHTNELELQNEAVACLALVDLGYGSTRSDFPSNTSAVGLNDGLTTYAIGDDQGNIRVRSLGDEDRELSFDTAGMRVSWISVSSNSRYVAVHATLANINRVTVRDLETNRRIDLDSAEPVPQGAFDFSADNSAVAIGLPSGKMSVYSLPDGGILRSWQLQSGISEPRVPSLVRFDPSGSRVAETSAGSHYVQVWQVQETSATNEPLQLYHRSRVTAMAWHPDGKELATASEHRDLYLWDLRFARSREFSQAHADEVIDLAYSSDGDLLASLGARRVLDLWTPATGRHLTQAIEGKPSGRLHFSRSGRDLGYATAPGGVQIWPVFGNEEYRVFRAPGEVNAVFASLCFSPEGRVLITASDFGTFLWDCATGRELHFLKTPPARSVFTHQERGDLFACTASGFYRWPRRVSRTTEAVTYRFGPCEPLDLPAGLGVSANCGLGKEVAVAHVNHLHLFDVEGSWKVPAMPVVGRVSRLEMSPDGQWLAARMANPDRARLWRLKRSDPPLSAPLEIPGCRHFAFSPDSRYFVSLQEGTCTAWKLAGDAATGAPILPTAIGDAGGPIALSPLPSGSGTLLAIADTPLTIKLYELSAEHFTAAVEVGTLESPDRKPLQALAFNRDGSRLAAAAADQTIEVWDLARMGNRLRELGLARGFPSFATSEEGELKVEFRPDPRDFNLAERPQQWRNVEQLTAKIAELADRAPTALSRLLVQRGECLRSLGRPAAARADLEEARRLNPGDEEIAQEIRAVEEELRRLPLTGRNSADTTPAGADPSHPPGSSYVPR